MMDLLYLKEKTNYGSNFVTKWWIIRMWMIDCFYMENYIARTCMHNVLYGLMCSPLKSALLHDNIKVDFLLNITILYTRIVCKYEFFELSKLSLKCILNVAFLWNFKKLAMMFVHFLIFKVYGHIFTKANNSSFLLLLS